MRAGREAAGRDDWVSAGDGPFRCDCALSPTVVRELKESEGGVACME